MQRSMGKKVAVGYAITNWQNIRYTDACMATRFDKYSETMQEFKIMYV